MDFPFFDYDFFGNRFLIAWGAILHVLINHPMAIGASLLIACMESRGHRLGDQRWDDLARRMLFVCFIITTTVGALTGVGIWLSTALVNPDSIGSLLRVFFWAWFTEWLVFIAEVVLVLAYYLTWKTWTGSRKVAHIRIGYAYAAMSFLTMALITAILGFMMTPGDWTQSRSLWDAILNPLYLPQLAFRTTLAMAMAGAMGLVLVLWFTERGSDFRAEAVRYCGRWTALWSLPAIAAAGWYLATVPQAMLDRAPTAIGTMRGEAYFPYILTGLVGLLGAALYVVATAWKWPRSVPRWGYVLPFAAMVILLMVFERTREFVRKPYIIGGYMYANGLRVEDYPLYQAEGLLKHHAFASVRTITAENRLQAGHEVFQIACATCHTTNPSGLNNVHAKFRAMLGDGPWKESGVAQIIGSMHGSRAYMPEFPGIPAERNALAAWIVDLHRQQSPPPPALPPTPATAKTPTASGSAPRN